MKLKRRRNLAGHARSAGFPLVFYNKGPTVAVSHTFFSSSYFFVFNIVKSTYKMPLISLERLAVMAILKYEVYVCILFRIKLFE